MKIFYFIKLSFMVLLFGIFSQIKAQSDSNIFVQKYNFSISSDLMNVLYMGINNPISIVVSNVSMDDLIVEMSNGNIIKIGDNFIARVNHRGEAAISVFLKLKSGKSMVGTMKFRVLDLPKPNVSLGQLENGDSVSLPQIQENNFPIFAAHRWIGCLEGVKYKILSFEFSILSKDAKIIRTIKVEGNKLNEEALNMINEISSGNSIMIDRIIAIGPRGKSYLEPIIIYIQ